MRLTFPEFQRQAAIKAEIAAHKKSRVDQRRARRAAVRAEKNPPQRPPWNNTARSGRHQQRCRTSAELRRDKVMALRTLGGAFASAYPVNIAQLEAPLCVRHPEMFT